MTQDVYDIAILGAGPIGLEAALRAADEGYKAIVIERGEVGQNVRDWGHVRMFSPFGMNSSERGRHAIAKPFDEDAYLTGHELADEYLEPLVNFASHSVQFKTGSTVEKVERLGWPKGTGLGDSERVAAPFAVSMSEAGDSGLVTSRCVIDTTGVSAISPDERGRLQILNGSEEVLDTAKGSDGRVCVVGTGATAATNVVTLAEAGVPFDWFTRHTNDDAIAELLDDPLPGRRELFSKANEIGRGPLCRRIPGRTYTGAREEGGVVTVETVDSCGTIHCDKTLAAIVNIGQRPDTSLFRELHVHLCYATEGPIKLAAKLLGESGSDCLSQSGSDASLLVNPEPNFFVLGAKSYGRGSNFLIRAGIEQVNAVFDELLPQSLWPLIGR